MKHIHVSFCIRSCKIYVWHSWSCMKRNVSWKVNCFINISSSSSYERNQINDSFLSPEPSKLAFTSTGALFLLSRYVTKELKSTISISSFVFKSNLPLTYVFMSRKIIYCFNFLTVCYKNMNQAAFPPKYLDLRSFTNKSYSIFFLQSSYLVRWKLCSITLKRIQKFHQEF